MKIAVEMVFGDRPKYTKKLADACCQCVGLPERSAPLCGAKEEYLKTEIGGVRV